jgi:hypothetical protein
MAANGVKEKLRRKGLPLLYNRRFTEDGSFIGQYVPSNMKQLGPPSVTAGVNNNAMATYV